MSLEYIHPIAIHFPIVLLIQAAALDLLVCARSASLSAQGGLALAGRLSLLAAAAAACLAVTFGYLAQDIAVGKGFPDSLIEQHEGLGLTTAIVLVVLAALRFAALRFGFALEGRRAQAATLLTLAAVGLLITTAYFGGELVYGHGVNVVPVKP